MTTTTNLPEDRTPTQEPEDDESADIRFPSFEDLYYAHMDREQERANRQADWY